MHKLLAKLFANAGLLVVGIVVVDDFGNVARKTFVQVEEI